MISLDTLWSRSAEVHLEENSLILKSVNLFMHNVQVILQNGQNTLKILQCEHRKIFKVCLTILQHDA